MDRVLVVAIMLIIVVGPLALIVWGCWRAFRHRNIPVHGFAALPASTQDSAGLLMATMTPRMREWHYRLSSQGQGGIVFSKTYRPAWLIVPCFFLFPFGLLSLLYSRTVDVSFSLFSQTDGRSEISVSGSAPSQLGEAIDDALSNLALGS